MNKRGQGLSITTIIVAAIALIVLVVLVAIFTGRLGIFTKGLQAAENKYCGDIPSTEKEPASSAGGQVISGQACPEGKIQIYGNFKEVGIGKICCSK